MKNKTRPTSIIAISLISILIVFSSFLLLNQRYDLHDVLDISRFVIEQNIILPLTCRDEDEKIVSLGYPKWRYCYKIFSDGDKTCVDGAECKSGVCILSFSDNEKTKLLASQFATEEFPFPQDASLSGICLGRLPKNVDKFAYNDCPTMSIHNGQIKRISFCPVY